MLRLLLLVPGLVLAAAAACEGPPPPPPEDGGPAACEGVGEPSIQVGAHGAEWMPLEDGTEIPCFDRPQGGVGTHLTVRFTGFPEDDNGFTLLSFDMTRTDDPESIVSDYRTRAFPLDCESDGALLLVDVPIRFAVGVAEAAAIENVAVTMTTTLELADGSTLTDEVELVLRESEFIPPAWWDQ